MFKDVERKCRDMIWGVVIILAFSALLALIVYLYEDHVDYLNKKIRGLQFEVDLTTECLDAHKEMVEDLEGYYEKWIETVNELSEANQKIYKYQNTILELQRENDRITMPIADKEVYYH